MHYYRALRPGGLLSGVALAAEPDQPPRRVLSPRGDRGRARCSGPGRARRRRWLNHADRAERRQHRHRHHPARRLHRRPVAGRANARLLPPRAYPIHAGAGRQPSTPCTSDADVRHRRTRPTSPRSRKTSRPRPTTIRSSSIPPASARSRRRARIRRTPTTTRRSRMTLALIVLVALVRLPLLRRDGPSSAWRGGCRCPVLTPPVTYFSAIGMGFMLIEISQMQRLIILLGHPVVLAGRRAFHNSPFWRHRQRHDRCASGSAECGDRSSDRTRGHARGDRDIDPPWSTHMGPVEIDRHAHSHIDVASGASGVRHGNDVPARAQASGAVTGTIPFFWSANGITSMLASVLGMALSIEFGIAKTYALGTGAYAACALMTIVVAGRQTSRVGLFAARPVCPDAARPGRCGRAIDPAGAIRFTGHARARQSGRRITATPPPFDWLLRHSCRWLAAARFQ